jgi:hypothetical protein
MSVWMSEAEVMARRPRETKTSYELSDYERRLADLKPLRVDLPIEGDGTTYRSVAEALRVMASIYEEAALAQKAPAIERFHRLKFRLSAPREKIRDELLPSQRPSVYNSKRNGVAR